MNTASTPTTPMTIQQMFEFCKAREERLLGPDSKTYYKNNVLAVYKEILFGTPLFRPEPIAGYPRLEKLFSKSERPFNFSVAQRWDDMASPSEWRYDKLLELLREEKDQELRLLLLARWLKQEKIYEPEQFLPKEILRSLVTRFFRSRRVSATDLSYWAAITGWKPYFARLTSDLQKLQRKGKDTQSGLREMGYDPAAIDYAMTKRSTVSAITHWIAERRHVQLATLRNAYARR